MHNGVKVQYFPEMQVSNSTNKHKMEMLVKYNDLNTTKIKHTHTHTHWPLY